MTRILSGSLFFSFFFSLCVPTHIKIQNNLDIFCCVFSFTSDTHTHMESCSKERLFLRTYIFKTTAPTDIFQEWSRGFTLAQSKEEISQLTPSSFRKRLHQAAFTLIANKKNSDPTNETLYNECVRLSKIIDTHSSTLSHHLLQQWNRAIEELENKIQQTVLPWRTSTIVGDSKRLRVSGAQGTLSCEFEIVVQQARLDTQNEQLDPELRVFFSQHLRPHGALTHVKLLQRCVTGSRYTVTFDHMPVPIYINGQYAVLRFFLFASFYPISEEHRLLPYKRKRPFYNGFIHVSELEQGSTYKVSMRDSSLAVIDRRLARDSAEEMSLLLKCNRLEWSPSVKFSSRYSKSEREKQQKMMDSLVERYYDFITRKEPSLDAIRSMHVPRMPCNMHDILLPGSMFVMDFLEDKPPEKLLDISLDIHNMTRQEFVDICSRQFRDSKAQKVSPQFHRACLVAFRVVCIYSHMCEYTADIKMNKSGQVEEVERFIDIFSTQAGDCEDLLRAIIVQYISWTQQDIPDENSPLYYLVKVLSLFVPCALSGSAYSPSAKSRSSPTSGDLICHIWGAAVPWYHYAKWTGISQTAEYEWERDLFPWILEGTNDSTPCLKPLFSICEPEKSQQVRQEMLNADSKRTMLESAYPALRQFGLYGFFRNFDHPTPPVISDFYHMVNELWCPYDMLRMGFNVSTFELYHGSTDKGYGVPIRALVYEPEKVIAKPVFSYSEEELSVCLETLKQQYPIQMMPEHTQQRWRLSEHAKEILEYEFSGLKELERDFPVQNVEQLINQSSGYFMPYLRYFVKDVKAISTEAMVTLRTVFSNRYLGFYGFQFRHYEIGEAKLVELRLFFSSSS